MEGAEHLAYVTAVKQAVNSSYEEKKTLKEFVCDELKRMGKGGSWTWVLFAISFIASSTFYAQLYFDVVAFQEPPAFFCLPSQLKTSNWTIDQIQQLSSYSNSTQSCMALSLNYSDLSKMSFDDAVDYVNDLTEVDGALCSEIGGEIYVLDGADETFADEFGLLCQETVSDVYAAFYKGCVLGGVVFGVLGDKFGRQSAFRMAAIPFMISSFIPAYYKTATVYAWARFVVGFCGFGIVNLLFVSLVENCQRKLREIFAVVINLSVVFGMMWQYTVSYEADGKVATNSVFLALSGCVLVAFLRFLVESPKHLIAKNDYEAAYVSLKGKKPQSGEFLQDTDQPSSTNFLKKQELVKFFCSSNYWHLTWLCMSIYAFWFFAFNFSDMKIDMQDFSSHIKILTVYDAFGYILTAFLVFWLPRKVLQMLLLVLMGTMLILSASLPSEELLLYQVLMIACRCMGNPAIALFCLHIAEIFPTEIRSTAVGVIGSVGYLAGYYATYIIEFVVNFLAAHNLPNFPTLLGATCIFFTILVHQLPETKHEELKDFVSHKHKVEDNCMDEVNEKNVKEFSGSSILFLLIILLSFAVFLCYLKDFEVEN